MKSYSKLIKNNSLIIIGFLFILTYNSQSLAQYQINGDATQDDCNCYTLTQDLNTQSGSVWNENKISLNSSFDYKFEVFLGYYEDGADGIAFVLQPISTSVGSSGGGMGYEGITPAVGVTIDTYQNMSSSDPTYDHIAIQLNGDIDHTSANNIAGPVSALASSPNIEDGQWHDFRITWDASTKEMKAFLDGSLRVSATVDLVNNIFSGDPMVYWGFTGSTGAKHNLQRFCTKNDAMFAIDNTKTYCLGDEINFQDSSSSFGYIMNWKWDFGDGNGDTLTTQGNTTHTYAAPGNYKVILQIEGNDGCTSSDSTTITVLQLPTATISGDTTVCQFDTPPVVTFKGADGTSPYVFTFNWSDGINTILDSVYSINGDIGTVTVPTNVPGSYTYSLTEVHNKDIASCSNPQTGNVTIIVLPQPDVSLIATPLTGDCPLVVNFNNTSKNTDHYSWNFGDGTQSNSNDSIVKHTFEGKGSYTTLLIGKNQECIDTAEITITVLCPEMQYEFPNVFTPNGDGENDNFCLINPNYIKDFEIVILNRWGNVVFESQEVNFQWNGKINNSGAKVTEGTYFYKAKLTGIIGDTAEEHGFIEMSIGN